MTTGRELQRHPARCLFDPLHIAVIITQGISAIACPLQYHSPDHLPRTPQDHERIRL